MEHLRGEVERLRHEINEKEAQLGEKASEVEVLKRKLREAEEKLGEALRRPTKSQIITKLKLETLLYALYFVLFSI